MKRALEKRLLRLMFPPVIAGQGQVRNLKQVAVFPRLGIAFNRLQKNGSSTVMSFLYFAEHGKRVSALGAKDLAIHLDSQGLRGITSLSRLTKMAVVRDPFSRTLSAFLQKFQSQGFQDKFGPFDLSPQGFSTFLQFLESGGLRANSHWSPQTDRLLLPPQHYNYLVPFSDFPKKFLEALDEVNPRLRQRFGEFSGYGIHGPQQTHASEKAAVFYSKTDLARVEHLYSKDFEVPEILNESEKLRREMRSAEEP